MLLVGCQADAAVSHSPFPESHSPWSSRFVVGECSGSALLQVVTVTKDAFVQVWLTGIAPRGHSIVPAIGTSEGGGRTTKSCAELGPPTLCHSTKWSGYRRVAWQGYVESTVTSFVTALSRHNQSLLQRCWLMHQLQPWRTMIISFGQPGQPGQPPTVGY